MKSDFRTGFYFAAGFMAALFVVNLIVRAVPAAVA